MRNVEKSKLFKYGELIENNKNEFCQSRGENFKVWWESLKGWNIYGEKVILNVEQGEMLLFGEKIKKYWQSKKILKKSEKYWNMGKITKNIDKIEIYVCVEKLGKVNVHKQFWEILTKMLNTSKVVKMLKNIKKCYKKSEKCMWKNCKYV